jgi:hypothetical protein
MEIKQDRTEGRKMHSNPLDFSGKVALVTGAAAGTGLATVKAFAEAGAAVALADYKEQAVEALPSGWLPLATRQSPFVAMSVMTRKWRRWWSASVRFAGHSWRCSFARWRVPRHKRPARART